MDDPADLERPSRTEELISPDVPERRARRLLASHAFGALKAQHAADRGMIERAARRLSDMAASTLFLTIHGVWFAAWILWNLGLLRVSLFDPYPFGFLTMVVSLEAIFLSIFVLIAQKRESAIAELREELALQINLRVEEETTKTLQLVAGLYTRLGHQIAEDPELHDMMQPLDVARLQRELALQIASAAQHGAAKWPAAATAPPGAPGSDLPRATE
jgi:uncharacterized membrane protein